MTSSLSDQRSAAEPTALPPYRHTAQFVLAAILLCAACSDSRTPLVIYSPHGRGLLTLAESTFEAAHPDVDVRWLDMGSQDVLDRLRSEKANPQADVWFGGPSTILALAAADSLLAPYRPSWADAIAPRGRAPGDLYFAAYETPVVIAYSRTFTPDDSAPTDWDQVLAPKWRDKILIRDPLASGTMRALWGMVMQRSLRATHDTAQGFAWLRRLDAQTREYVPNPALLNEKLLRGEGRITLWDLPDILGEVRDGHPFWYTLPTSGTPVIEDGIAIVRGAKHSAQARQFVEWVGSVEGQLSAARHASRLPARTDLPADSMPQWAKDVRAKLVVETMDWEQLTREGPRWMAYWDQHVRGRGRTTR
jgi:iron(III) transport system substrate-binding protein